MRLTWAQPEDLIAHELVQARAEGKDVQAVERAWLEAGGDAVPAVSGASAEPAPPALRERARRLLADLDLIPAPEAPDEPDDWPAIAALLPEPRRLEVQGDYAERVLGAWTGRAAGCLLGKPVEKIPRQGIEEILRATDRWPLERWFTERGLRADVAARWPWNKRSRPTSLEENIDGMPEDDDLNYPILALALLERFGEEFTTDDVATMWLENLPAGRVFTAERIALRNILDARPAPETATHQNPFREWIGALIRTDVFGWIRPGDVTAAAELAWRDARLSHTRNGVYGAMWAAGLGAASMVADTVDDALDLASAAVPPASRLAGAIAFGRETAADTDLSEDGVREALDRLHERYGDLHWVHVLNNAATIAYALAAGHGDFGRSISLAVMAGWDTDSVGATVGAVAGAINRVDGIGAQWVEPLRGRIATSMPGGDQDISTLATRTIALSTHR